MQAIDLLNVPVVVLLQLLDAAVELHDIFALYFGLHPPEPYIFEIVLQLFGQVLDRALLLGVSLLRQDGELLLYLILFELVAVNERKSLFLVLVFLLE